MIFLLVTNAIISLSQFLGYMLVDEKYQTVSEPDVGMEFISLCTISVFPQMGEG